MTDRDRVIERALGRIRTPEHDTGFWESLEEALDEEDGVDTTKRSRTRVGPLFLAAAAVVAVVAAALAVVARDDSGARQQVRADEPGVSTTAPTVSGTPDEAVLAWLEAIGSGDFDAAAALVGPRSRAYVEALGGNVEGMVRESQEGYGAWPDSPDMSTTEVDLGDIDGAPATIVVVSGTWTGEGDTEFRHDAIPAVRHADGWLVEPWAFSSDTGGRLSITSPTPLSSQRGLGPLAPDDVISALAAGSGDFYFSLNDGEVTRVAGEKAGAGVKGTWDPPGDMPSQTHLVVIAYANGDTLTAFAGTFRVD